MCADLSIRVAEAINEGLEVSGASVVKSIKLERHHSYVATPQKSHDPNSNPDCRLDLGLRAPHFTGCKGHSTVDSECLLDVDVQYGAGDPSLELCFRVGPGSKVPLLVSITDFSLRGRLRIGTPHFESKHNLAPDPKWWLCGRLSRADRHLPVFLRFLTLALTLNLAFSHTRFFYPNFQASQQASYLSLK